MHLKLYIFSQVMLLLDMVISTQWVKFSTWTKGIYSKYALWLADNFYSKTTYALKYTLHTISEHSGKWSLVAKTCLFEQNKYIHTLIQSSMTNQSSTFTLNKPPEWRTNFCYSRIINFPKFDRIIRILT